MKNKKENDLIIYKICVNKGLFIIKSFPMIP